MRLSARIADKINPRDFMYYDNQYNKSVWLYLLEDSMTKDDTEGYEIITFDGGLFAAAIADSWEYSEYERISRGVESWLARQEHLTLDESGDRHILYHYAGPHSARMKDWNYGKVRYFIPLKVKEGT